MSMNFFNIIFNILKKVGLHLICQRFNKQRHPMTLGYYPFYSVIHFLVGVTKIDAK